MPILIDEQRIIECYRILETHPNNSEALFHLGLHAKQQQLSQVAHYFWQRLLQHHPQHFAALNELAEWAQTQKQWQLALNCYQSMLKLNPQAGIWGNMGKILKQQEQWETALHCFQQALALDSTLLQPLIDIGDIFNRLQQAEKALQCFQQILQRQPDYLDALIGATYSSFQLNQIEQALIYCQRGLQFAPQHPALHNALGILLDHQNQLEQALPHYHQALSKKPDFPEAWNNLGMTLCKLHRYQEAVTTFERAIRLRPAYPEALNNLGFAYSRFNQLEQAIQWFNQALEIQPEYPQALYNRADCFLKSGRFNEGWEGYEYRRVADKNNHPQIALPLWDGSPLQGRRLLVHYEQGFGDTIQFIRYLALIQGGTIIFACPAELQSLLENVAGIDELIVSRVKRPVDYPADVWIPLLSLPRVLKTTVNNAPKQVPYLRAASQKIIEWQYRLQTAINPPKKRIGIVWAGNPKHSNDRNRSCPAAIFNQLTVISATHPVQFINLQKGLSSDAARPQLNLLDYTEHLQDFSDTAALITNLDLVICVDTAVAHLAGALNIPVWVLLPYHPDWRWLLQREDSIWYPSMRLFRQPRLTDWSTVMQEVVKALNVWLV